MAPGSKILTIYIHGIECESINKYILAHSNEQLDVAYQERPVDRGFSDSSTRRLYARS